MITEKQDTIDILMATYNGAEYIRQQIHSILSQTYTQWRLYIHDDGSTDNTVDIVKEFSISDSRIVLIEDNTTFHSCQHNFLHLLSFSTSPLTCFCDQDDIWLENKLEILSRQIRDIKTNKPACVFSDAYLLFNGHDIKGELSYKYTKLKDILYVNGGIHGCRGIFNEPMRNEMLKYRGSIDMHDHLLGLIACTFGKVKYIKDKLFLYRQHEKNVSGHHVNSLQHRLKNALRNYHTRGLYLPVSYDFILGFYNCYNDFLTAEQKKSIEQYLNIRSYHRIKRFVYILMNGFTLGGSRLNLLLKTIFFPLDSRC